MNIQLAKQLLKTFDKCRYDMHEPDEQGFRYVRMVGDHLDNACGALVAREAILLNYQEYVLIFKEDEVHTSIENVKEYMFNLATLIAFARVGAQALLDSEQKP